MTHLIKVLLLILFSALSSCTDNLGILSVHGSSISSLKPDQATITFQITSLNMSAKESLKNNNQIITNAISALTQLNLTNNEIGTSDFNLGPSYQYIYYHNNTSSNIFKGYQVTNTLIVKTNKMDMVGNIIDTAVKSGVENIQSVDFEISPSLFQSVHDDMLQNAVRNAKSKAELALKPINGKIVGIKNINLNQKATPRPVPMYQAKAAAVANFVSGSTEVYAEKKNLNVGVDVQFYVTN